MNLETKVGLFVLIGAAISTVGVMKLGDFHLEKRMKLYFIFPDVENLREKSVVKVSGVEVGRVRKIGLDGKRARIEADIKRSVPIYSNGRVRVKTTGVIGTQYLDLDPGTPEGTRLKDGDVLYGQASRSLNDLMEKLSELIGGKDGKPGVGDNLQATMANLRSITDSLNYALGRQRDELKDIVENLHQFTVDLKGVASDLHQVTSARKQDIDQAIVRLRSILERVDDLVARVQRGEGSVGKLVADKEMGEEVKKTVSNLKETSQSAKEVLARFTKVRSFWEFQGRAVPGADTVRGDGGLRLQPRDGKYYYLGVNNAGDRKNEFKNEGDYEKMNTITAILGKEFGPVTVEVGAIRSSAGIGFKYFPFGRPPVEVRPNVGLRPFSLEARAYDFGRNEVRGRAGRERSFDKPQYDLGARYRVNRWVELGAAVEDLAVLKQYNVSTHLIFEDRDLAYLFGFVSFAR